MRVYSSTFSPASLPRLSVYAHIVPSSEQFAPDAPAFIDAVTNQTITRRVLREESLRIARGLRNIRNIGGRELGKGSTVTVFSPNTTLYPIIVLATAAAGIRAAFANSAYTERELAHVFKDSGSSHVLVHITLLQKVISTLKLMDVSLEDAKKRVVIISPRSTIPNDILESGWITYDNLIPGIDVLPEDFSGEKSQETAYIYYSSGTTGLSKGVEITHFNVTSVLEQSQAAWQYYEHGRDVIIGVIPFFHVFGGNIVQLCSYATGIPVVVHSSFNPEQFLSSIARHRVTVALLVPPLIGFLASSPLVDKFDVSSLRILLVGGAPLSEALVKQTIHRLSSRGARVAISQAMGLTETSGSSHVLPLELSEGRFGSVGLLVPNMEARLVDDSGIDVPEGEPGELWLRGPNVMKGYLGNPQATKETFSPDGWFKTGDVLTRDKDGFYTVVDRKKELIKYKGFQVPPAELEAILATNPTIADVAVIGIYSEKDTTELPRAFIVPKNPAVLRQTNHAEFVANVHKWLKSRVAPYKQLRGGIVVTEAIPRSAAGKILKKDLRARAKL